ncbi:catalase [Umezawaea sp. Da 62-37]|nr:catalase [Umezawaea sp. Da 62-37]WNV92182.1 catalase [Umezawaea sp. Da 62-37]
MGRDHESHQRDLCDAIERGDFPKWTLHVQVMPEADAEHYRFHPFDLTTSAAGSNNPRSPTPPRPSAAPRTGSTSARTTTTSSSSPATSSDP